MPPIVVTQGLHGKFQDLAMPYTLVLGPLGLCKASAVS